MSKFERVLTMVPRLVSLPDSAGSLRRLKQAALQDESGEALSIALADLERA
jgi:hypothetical protein